MKLEEIIEVPTGEEIVGNIFRKYIWNNALCEMAKEYQIFKINNKEYVITEIKNLQITFSSIENAQEDITRYIEDLHDLHDLIVTDYFLDIKSKRTD